MNNRLLARMLVLPAIVYVGIFCVYPLLWMFWASLGMPRLDAEAYGRVISDPTYAIVGQRTFFFSAQVTLLTLLIGYPVAAFLSAQTDKGRSYVMVAIGIPYLTSILVRTYAWILLLGDAGPVNSMLLYLGIVDVPVQLVFNRIGALVGTIHVTLPLMILPIYAVMRGVDRNLVRAAYALGGGPVRTFFRVYFPQTYPGVVSGVTLVFVLVLGFYIIPAALGGLRETLLSNIIYNIIQFSQDFPLASAISMFLLALTVATYFALSSLDRRGDTFAPSSRAMRAPRATGGLAEFLGLDRLADRLWRARAGRPGIGISFPRGLFNVFSVLVLLFLIVPNLIVLAMSFSDSEVLSFPPESVSLRWYRVIADDPQWMRAFGLSFQIAIAASACAMLLGSLAAYGLVRTGNGSLRTVILSWMLIPMIVPTVVIGVGLFGLFTKWGLLGSPFAIFLTHIVSGIPYVVLIVYATMRNFDWGLERAAQSLGASRLRTVTRIIVPVIAPGLAAAAVFAFISSFDEVVKTSFIAGVNTRTLPLKIWDNILFQTDPSTASVSSLLLVFPLVAFLLLRGRLTMR